MVADARIALEHGATAMHDPTEAGVVGALWEMAEAYTAVAQLPGMGADPQARRKVYQDAVNVHSFLFTPEH